MKKNPYDLKNLPPLANRPKNINLIKWFFSLIVFFLVGSICLKVLFGSHVETVSWVWIILTIFLMWLAIFIVYVLMWLILHIRANGMDKAREDWILNQTRKSRRALQILYSGFITCHISDQSSFSPLQSLMKNKDGIISQIDRRGNSGIRHSQLPYSNTEPVLTLIKKCLNELLIPITQILKNLPSDTPVKILTELSTSVEHSDVKGTIRELMSNHCSDYSMEFISGSGMELIEDWLENNIHDHAVLLVLAMQVDPGKPDGTAEAMSAILFGNRLTQRTISPKAFLHRPDLSTSDALECSMQQAAYNVPLQDNVVKSIWLSNLTAEQYQTVIKNVGKYPTEAVEPENIIYPDTTIGHAGAASQWLICSAAACAAEQMEIPQMLIIGDGTKNLMWSGLIMPAVALQEKES
ncbi:hypothetical protein [Enterobacter soli]|uniref:hypothetical protein n=1 Tax=Enterobacter soli TaxID=885040 RepID=UPI0034CFA6A7